MRVAVLCVNENSRRDPEMLLVLIAGVGEIQLLWKLPFLFLFEAVSNKNSR